MKRYTIKHVNRQSATEGYSFDKHAFLADAAQDILQACALLSTGSVWTMVEEGNLAGIGIVPEQGKLCPGILPPTTNFTHVELHLSPHDTGWTRKFGKAVKAAGGTYTACRGYSGCRFVTLPVTEYVLIDEIVKHEISRGIQMGCKGKVEVTMIARNLKTPQGYDALSTPAWMTVHKFDSKRQALGTLSPTRYLVCVVWSAIASAISRGIWREEGAEVKSAPMVTVREVKSAPMVTVPPPTPITALDRCARTLAKIDKAIDWMKESNIHHTPMWSELQAARQEITAAINKLA